MQSETIGALAAALAKAQGAIKPAPMDRDNPFFKNRYATLTSLWESARAALSTNGLAVVQTTDFSESGDLVLVTTLMHNSGEWVGSAYPVRAKDGTPQALGSALTYARRYAFGALVGLTSDDDDDGNGANGNGAGKGEKKAPPPPKESKPATNGKPGQSPEAKAFHKAGETLYAQDWETKRHELVKKYTKGRTESSKDLTPDELVFLTTRMEAKLQEQLDGNSTKNGAEMQP